MPEPIKIGDDGTTALTVLLNAEREAHTPYYEQVGQRFTITDHPDGEDRPADFMNYLIQTGEVKAGAIYLVIVETWKSYTGTVNHYVDAELFTTHVTLKHL